MSSEQTWEDARGRYWAERADFFTRLLVDYGEAVLAAAALQPGERVLDVGCGNGDLTIAAARVVGPTGAVVGVDVSPDELDVALARLHHEDLANIALRQADAGADELGPDPFDVLISRFGVMFFTDSVAAFTHLHGAMADGGRLAFVCWQRFDENEWMVVPGRAIESVLPVPLPLPGTPGAYAFAEADHVRGVLTRAGFGEVTFEEVRRPVHLGDVESAVDFVRHLEYARSVLEAAPPEEEAEALDRVREALAGHVGPDGEIDLPGAAWLVRARA